MCARDDANSCPGPFRTYPGLVGPKSEQAPILAIVLSKLSSELLCHVIAPWTQEDVCGLARSRLSGIGCRRQAGRPSRPGLVLAFPLNPNTPPFVPNKPGLANSVESLTSLQELSRNSLRLRTRSPEDQHTSLVPARKSQ